MCTHEQFVQNVRQLAVHRLHHSPELAAKLQKVKLVYGVGQSGLRGVTWFDKWAAGEETCDLAEICAFGEQDHTQLAGTTLHELAHVIAGPQAGHGKEWKDACKLLGLRVCKAAGQHYLNAVFTPDVRMALAAMPTPQDGKPHTATHNHMGALIAPPKIKPCTLGIGTRGGKSRGIGSGSRMRKYTCDCGVIIRAARDDLHAHCDDCGTAFTRA